MAYATVSDVTALNAARTFTGSSVPNTNQVAGYLTETAAVLDSILGARGFTLPVPITATSALELLEHYNAIGAHSFAENAAPSSPHADAAAKAWERAQKMLADGLIEPPGLTRDIASTRARVGGSPTPWFPRGMCL